MKRPLIRIGVIRIGVVAGLVAASTALAAPAQKPPTLTDVSADRFPERTLVLTLPQRSPITTADVDVTENGGDVDNLSVVPAGAAGASGNVLLIDASNSMRGAPIRNEMQAARAFAARNPNQPLAVIAFNDLVTPILSFTTDRAKIRSALAKTPKNREGTHIYDAVDLAVGQLSSAGYRSGRIVLLSDGQEVRSTISRETALGHAKSAGVRIYTIGLQSYAFDAAYLRSLSSETAATYAEATSPQQLEQIYEQLGFRFANEYLVLYRSLQTPQQPVEVAVKVKGYPQAIQKYTTPKLAPPAKAEKNILDRLLQSPLSMVVVVSAMLALIWYAVTSLWGARQGTFRRRISGFVTMPAEEEARARQAEVRSILSGYDKTFRRGRLLRGFAEDTELAGIETSPATLAVLAVLGGLVLGLFAAVVIDPLWFVLAVAPPIVLRVVVSVKVARMRKAFGEQLPDNLDVFAQSLRAGHSLVGALAVVSDSAPEPSKTEFARVVQDENLGVPLDDALVACVERMHNRDLDQVALVALLQRDAGGNSAEVIDQVSENIRVRQELRRLARTLTAQGRLARWILTLLPVVIFGLIWMLNKEYLEPLWTTTYGIMAIIVAVLMDTAGSFWVRKIVDIKV